MTSSLNERSQKAMVGVHPWLLAVAEEANKQYTVKYGNGFTIIEGLRTQERQDELWSKGRTTKGPIVTWVKVSKHQKQPDGYGHAFDAVEIKNKEPDWTSCDRIAKEILAAAKKLRTRVRWGKDWDEDGNVGEKGEYDGPHFELVIK